jgi:peptidyl-prolyl cis-trans isomerase B (cyclophilin B)
MKRCVLMAICTLLLFTAGLTAGCSPDDSVEEPPQQAELPDIVHGSIILEDGGVIRFELYPKSAPISVSNFVSLAQEGFYDGLNFHRILKGMMIQGGCPEGTGGGGPGYTIKGEFSDNGVDNTLSHVRGAISMARRPDYDSAGSQFFIVHQDSSRSWDGQYAVFGMVVDGFDVVDRLADTPNSGPNGAVAPEDRPVMKTITIDIG